MQLRHFLAGLAMILLAMAVAFIAFTTPESASSKRRTVPEVSRPQASKTAEAPPTPTGPRAPQQQSQPSTVGLPKGLGSIYGQVVDGASGERVAGAEVTAYYEPPRNDPSVESTLSLQSSTHTDNTGHFVLTKLPTERVGHDRVSSYHIVARADDAVGVGYINLTDEAPEPLKQLELWATGSISGRVVGPDGEGLPQAWLTPHPVEDELPRVRGGLPLRVASGADGYFMMQNLALGPWALTVLAEGFAPMVTAPIRTGTGDAQIRLQIGGGATGSVVYAPDGNPAAGLTIEALPYRGPAFPVATTDTNGRFVLAHLPDARYSLTIKHDTHFVLGNQPTFEIRDQSHIENMLVTLAEGGVISGRVYDKETGEPLPGVGIQVVGPLRPEGVTDVTGVYRIAGVPPGIHKVRRNGHKGYLRGEQREDKQITLKLGEELGGVDFAVQKGIGFRGLVVDEAGAPIAGAYVHSSSSTHDTEREGGRTGKDGQFEHTGYSPHSTVHIFGIRDGYSQSKLQSLQLASTDLDDVHIVLDWGTSAAGVLVDASGSALHNYSVSANSSVHPSGAYTQTDRMGRFVLEGLKPGPYLATANPPSEYQAQGEVGKFNVVEQQPVKGLRFVYHGSPHPTISGVVVNEAGEPLAKVYINGERYEEGELRHQTSAETHADGKFQLHGLEEGEYKIDFNSNLYSSEELTVPTGRNELTVVLKGRGTIEGVVTGPSGPLDSFEVAAVGAGSQGFEGGEFWAFADPAGRFVLENVQQGEVKVSTRAKGYAPETVTVNAVSGGRVTGVIIAMQTAAGIRGRVVDAAGAPVEGANIACAGGDTAGAEELLASKETDAAGTFEFEGLQQDVYTLVVTHEVYLEASVEVAARANVTTPIEIGLDRGGVIEGIATVGGEAAVGATIWLQFQGPRATHKRVLTDDQGFYSASGLPPGGYTLDAHYGGGDGGSGYSQQAHVMLSESEVVHQDFLFAEGDARIAGRVFLDGALVNRGEVYVHGFEQQGRVKTQVGPNGHFELQHLEPAQVMVSVDLDQPLARQNHPAVMLVAGQVIRLDIHVQSAVPAQGRLLGVKPEDEAQVVVLEGSVRVPRVTQQELTSSGEHVQVAQYPVSDTGAFPLPDLAPGMYTFVVFVGPEQQLATVRTVNIQQGPFSEVEIRVR